MIVTFYCTQIEGQVANNAYGRLEVFALGGDKGLYHIWQSIPNGYRGEWSSLGGTDLQKIALGNNTDEDHDGISDNKEQKLLARFRPCLILNTVSRLILVMVL